MFFHGGEFCRRPDTVWALAGLGSWYVRTRAMAFQRHFDAGFTHGFDQWISAVGSSWATLALLPAQAPRTRKPAIEANASCPPSLESIIELCPFTTFQYFDHTGFLSSPSRYLADPVRLVISAMPERTTLPPHSSPIGLPSPGSTAPIGIHARKTGLSNHMLP